MGTTNSTLICSVVVFEASFIYTTTRVDTVQQTAPDEKCGNCDVTGTPVVCSSVRYVYTRVHTHTTPVHTQVGSIHITYMYMSCVNFQQL